MDFLSMFAGPEGARAGLYILLGLLFILIMFFSISSTILFLIIGLSTLIPLVYFNEKKKDKLYDENNNLTKTAKGLLITTFISFILAIILYVYSFNKLKGQSTGKKLYKALIYFPMLQGKTDTKQIQ